MTPQRAVGSFWETVKANAQGMPYRLFVNTFAGVLVGYLKEHYPDPAALEQAIAQGQPVLDQALASVPADSLAFARTVAGSAAANAGVEDYDRILAGVGQELPEHEAVLYRNGAWYVAAMDRAKAWFLGQQP